jgi:hypothetical protein
MEREWRCENILVFARNLNEFWRKDGVLQLDYKSLYGVL